MAGEDAERVRVGNVRCQQRVGQAAGHGRAALQQLREPGPDDRRDRAPQHRPPPAGRQAAVREEEHKDDQRRDRQLLCAVAERGDLPDRGQRSRRRGQATQAVLLQEQAYRQREPRQAEQPADRVARDPRRDQPPDPGVHDDRHYREDVCADAGRAHHSHVERQEHQRPGQDQQDETRQRPGQDAGARAAGLGSHVADCGGHGPEGPGWRQHHLRRATIPSPAPGGPAASWPALLGPLTPREGRPWLRQTAGAGRPGARPGRPRGWP